MSMPTPENPHTVRKETHELVYWSGGSASGPVGADRVELKQFWENFGRITVGEFRLPAQARELERLEDALSRAFVFGRKSKAQELRRVIGCD